MKFQSGLISYSGNATVRTSGKNLPLIVISHGHGGSFLGRHDLAEVLADSGFVVAAINHPGDTFSDMSPVRIQNFQFANRLSVKMSRNSH